MLCSPQQKLQGDIELDVADYQVAIKNGPTKSSANVKASKREDGSCKSLLILFTNVTFTSFLRKQAHYVVLILADTGYLILTHAMHIT